MTSFELVTSTLFDGPGLINLGILFCVFGAAWVGSAAMRHYAMVRGMMDIPNARSSHSIPTPRGGGIAFVFSFSFALVALALRGAVDPLYCFTILPGSLLVAAVGFWDDRSSLPALTKLALHLVAAALVVYFMGGWNEVTLGWGVLRWGWLGSALGVLALAWMVNLYNFMDGIDGLAISQAIFLALSAALFCALTGGEYLVPGVLGAACLGFAFLNWPPAKLFMGDAGSGFLGMVFGVLALDATNSLRTTIWPWLILLGVFLVDATFTLAVRVMSGQRWLQPHCSHAYQKAARFCGTHRPVTITVVLINLLWLLPLALAAFYLPGWGALICVLALSPLLAMEVILGAGQPDVVLRRSGDTVLAGEPALADSRLQTEMGN